MSTTTAAAIIDRLEAHGVRHVFGLPGTHSLPLYRRLSESSIAHVVCRHEQSLAYAADGYARSSGRPGVCLTTTGPALLNALAALGTSYADSVPVLALAPGLPANVDGRDMGYLHECRAQARVMAELLGRSYRVASPADAATLIDAAFASFATERPRPVYLEVPLDVMEAAADGRLAPPPTPGAPAHPDPELIEAAASKLEAARSGAIVLGGGAVDAGDLPLRLARALQMPVVTSVNGKGVVPETDDLSLGASLRLRSCHELLQSADVVLAVGTELAESDLWREPPLDFEGELIRIDVDPAQLHKNVSPGASLAAVADARAALEALVPRLEGAERRDRGAERAQRVRAALVDEASADAGPYVALMRQLDEALEDDVVVATDSAMAGYYGAVHFLPLDRPRSFLMPTGFATLGYGLPAAIGAKLANPDRRTLVLIGDGGALFTIAELATIVQLQLPLPILIVNNGGYGEIRRLMLEAGQEPLGTDLHTPDFAQLARAFGAGGHRVADPDDLPELLWEADRASGPTVIELEYPTVEKP